MKTSTNNKISSSTCTIRPSSRILIALGLLAVVLINGCQRFPPAPTPSYLPLPPKTQWKVTASGIQEQTFAAANACDGRLDTRWSSPFSDPQWLQIDLGSTATVCGMIIHWETAYASVYEINASTDGIHWTRVYRNERGDGHTDDIYFRPLNARYLRLTGIKRATGWGYSIFEIHIKGAEEIPIVRAVSAPGSDPNAVFDGDFSSAWIGTPSRRVQLDVDLRKNKTFAGLRLDWGTRFARDLVMSVSTDGTHWTEAGRTENGKGRFDVIMSSPVTGRYLRLEMTRMPEKGPVEIREITLRGPDEKVTPLSLYELAAQKAAPGRYPLYLLKRQVYWTVVGLPEDYAESLFDEFGDLEPVRGSFSITPCLSLDGRLITALDAARTTQSLADGYLPLPAVTWETDRLRLTIQALATGSPSDSFTRVHYRIDNLSATPAQVTLHLLIRPLQVNPPWQFGGCSPIRSITMHAVPDGHLVEVNGKPAVFLSSPPQAFTVVPFNRGDIIEHLSGNPLTSARQDAASSTNAFFSAALDFAFDLKPLAPGNVTIAIPLHTTSVAQLHSTAGRTTANPFPAATDFLSRREAMKTYWHDLLDRLTISLPVPGAAEMLKSQAAYILINRDGPAIQPGPRNYKRSWIRDGGLSAAALLRLGFNERVRRFLDWYAARIQQDGWVPPILNTDGSINKGFGWNNEYDSQGEFVYAVMEYYRFTGDRVFLKKQYGHIVAALRYLAALRRRTLRPDYMRGRPAPERFRGILPPSISHEGYSPAMHSYWDDFWALRGWKDGAAAAEVLGDTNTAAWARREYADLRESLRRSILATVAFKGIDYVPGCADKGDFDPTSTAIAFFPCEEADLLPAKLMKNTFARYYADMRTRLAPDWSGSFTPYEVRSIGAFTSLDQPRHAAELLDMILAFRRPRAWNVLAEVVHSDLRLGSYIGDMPHTWVGSGYINSLRGMLIYEAGGKLLLLRGVPREWLVKGPISLQGMPTYFGRLDLGAREEGDTFTLTIGGTAQPPEGLVLFWPRRQRPVAVELDGQPWNDYGAESCRLPAGSHTLTAHW